jgi:hypothetical protein
MVTSLCSKWAAGKAVRAGLAVEGADLNRSVTDPASAGQLPAHFQRNPPGRGRLAVFPRCSLDPYLFGYGRIAPPASLREALRAGRALKIRLGGTGGDVTIICETAH